MRRVYRKSPFSYVLPFLILVGFGVIGVLGFQVWSNMQGTKGDALFYIVNGKAKILPSSQGEWENAYSGTKLLVGDSLKTTSDGRLILQFFNGTRIRLAEDTQVKLIDVSKGSDSERIIVALDHGQAWFNKMRSEDVQSSSLEVQTAHMDVKDTGTIFEVEKNTVESLRVLQGSVQLNIYPDPKNRVSVAQEVGVGQEVDVDEALLKALQNHENPSLLLEIRQEFKDSSWYAWNMAEDKSPTDYSSGNFSSDSQYSPSDGSDTQQSSEENRTSSSSITSEVVTDSSSAPTIENPSSAQFSTDQSKMTITGKVPEGTQKVKVEQVIDGKKDGYTLGKFKAGSTIFSYNISELLGNYKPGENTYDFYAIDKDGNVSDPARVIITYTKSTPVITEALTAPVVKTYNSSSSSVITTSSVKVEGEVHGAAKVVVNGYTLGKFQPGSTTWAYFASETAGNLKPGVNQFEVYGVDSNGKESEHVKFTVTYNKPATSTTQQTTQTTISPVPSSAVSGSTQSTVNPERYGF